jgi:uncharacterized Zn finger protein (UPF0148 family)
LKLARARPVKLFKLPVENHRATIAKTGRNLRKKMKVEIHFECPKCKRPMSGEQDLVFHMIPCPDCGHEFYPVAKPAEEQERFAAPQKQTEELKRTRTESELYERVNRIRKMAGALSVIAGVSFAVGVIMLFVTLKKTIAEMEADVSGWILTGSFLAFAICFFLIAQIVHIRANTEK